MVSSAKKFDSWMGSKRAGKATLPPLPLDTLGLRARALLAKGPNMKKVSGGSSSRRAAALKAWQTRRGGSSAKKGGDSWMGARRAR
jgi:hypothetical protein